MIKKIQQIMHNSWLIWGIFFCTVLTLFIYRSYSVLDPDFGWHVRMGEEIIAKGIPATDPFSYSMPSYPFVDYEWLTNALFYFGLQNIGYLGLSIIFSTLAVIALVIQRFAWPKQFALFSQLVGAAVLTDFVGIRPQVITWLFFSFLLTVLLKDGIWGRLRYIMPLLFLFWANMHGGFIVGLICLFIWALYQAKIEYLSKLDAIIIVICFLITLLNPYSYHLWTEIWLILTDSSLHQAIAEWRPSVFYQNFPGWLLMLVSTIGVIYYRKKLGGLYFIIFFFLLLSALSSIRNFSLFILIAIPLTTQVIQLFYKEIKNPATTFYW